MKRLSFSIILLLSCGIFGFAQEQDSIISISTLVNKALEHNRALKNKKLELERQEVIKGQIYHTYIPTVEASGIYSYASGKLNVDTDPIPFTFPGISLPLPSPMPPLTIPEMPMAIPGIDESLDFNGSLWMGGVTAKWTLFTGLKAPYLGKAQKHRIHAEQIMLVQAEADVIESVVFYYDKLALLDQAEKVLKESEKRLERETKVAERALQEGLITHHHYQKIEIAKLELESKLIEYRGSKALLHLKLQQLTGVPFYQFETLTVDLEPMLQATIDGSYIDRPEIKALDEAILANEYKLKSETSGYLPKVQAFATHQYAGLKNGELGPLGFNTMSAYPLNAVGVGFKWELFDGLHTHSERQKVKITIAQTQNKRDEAAELLQLNYNSCYNDYQVSSAQVSLKDKQKAMSKKSLEISYKEFQNGLIQVSDFLEAQTDYEKAVLDYYQMVFNQRQSSIRLLNAIGRLNTLTVEN